MTQAMLTAGFGTSDTEDTRAASPRMAADWPLMSDILSHRCDLPEHLLRWRQAEREASGQK